LGTGWTSLPTDKENLITIKHQLSMTTGLDDGVEDPYCTNPECLTYKADAGERWAYHNAPYTLLDGVIEGASGKSINQYYFNELRNKIGMNGFFIKSGFNNVLYTNARSMARFGLLILNKGNWDTIQILSDSAYYREMINTSQNINLSYGYLWWLNGKESFMIPQSQFVFNSVLNPSAPADMFCALGKNGQILNIVPSKNLIVVRMGNAPDNSLVPFLLNEEMWQLINPIIEPTSLIKDQSNGINFSLSQNYPNPFNPLTTINFSIPKYSKVTLKVYDVLGKEVSTLLNEELNPGIYNKNWDASNLSSGIYFYRLQSGDYIETKKLCLIK
jgi:CubicO group peptidase (beta-lactamase class C family)